jgi:DtxR family manganese transport transcriptional regulator
MPANNAYIHSRHRNQNEVAEDYVELIDDMISAKGEARAVDLAKKLGVSDVTVSKTVKRLIEAGLVHSEPYRAIFLTESGKALAGKIRWRHTIVRDFLIALGVPAKVADIDAEGIEHHASQSTIEAMSAFIENREIKTG